MSTIVPPTTPTQDVGIEYGVPDHPAPFPISIPLRCIQATGAQSVLDPFCGSGTTLRAAADMHIRGIGIEDKARFCDLAISRLDQTALDLGGIA